MFKRLILGAATAAALTVPAAQAAPFGVFDPRSLAMGGIGVSSATSQNASFFNPALLSAAQGNDDFSLEIPILAVRAADPDKLADDIDNLDSTGTALSNAVNQFNAAQNQANAQVLANALGAFNGALGTVSNKPLDAGLFVGTLVAIPSRTLGFAAHVSARADFGVTFSYAAGDATLMSLFQAAAQLYATSGNAGDLNALVTTYGSGGLVNNPNITSTMRLQGLVIEETGVSLSHRFDSLGGMSIGVTPKSLKVSTLDYQAGAQSATIDFDMGKREYSDTNLDIGVAMDYGSGYKTGLVVKNVQSKSYDTVLGNKIELKPQARLGMSHHNNWSIVGVDVDLTKNDPAGFLGKQTQFAAIGAEFNLISLLQLRVGYRHDLAGNYDGMYSVGVGFSPLGIHLDVGLAGNDNEVAAALQFGLSF